MTEQTFEKKKRVRKSVMLSSALHDRLDNCTIAKRGDSYGDIIKKLLDFYDETVKSI